MNVLQCVIRGSRFEPIEVHLHIGFEFVLEHQVLCVSKVAECSYFNWIDESGAAALYYFKCIVDYNMDSFMKAK